MSGSDNDLLKISRGQLKMLLELVDLKIEKKLDEIPIIDSLEHLDDTLQPGEVRVLRTTVIKKLI